MENGPHYPRNRPGGGENGNALRTGIDRSLMKKDSRVYTWSIFAQRDISKLISIRMEIV